MLWSSSSRSSQAGLALTASASRRSAWAASAASQAMCRSRPARTVGSEQEPRRLDSITPHALQLLASRDQGVQGPDLGRGQRPGLGADRLGEVGQGLGVDPVGLGQASGGLGEVAGLARG